MTNFKHHVRTHTCERPYKCPQCDYRATQQEHVNTHMLVHLGESAPKVFACPHSGCSYATNRQEHLRRHLKSSVHAAEACCPTCSTLQESIKKWYKVKLGYDGPGCAPAPSSATHALVPPIVIHLTDCSGSWLPTQTARTASSCSTSTT